MYTRVTAFIMEKIDPHLKLFSSNSKRNTKLSFTSIKQVAEHHITITNYGRIYFKKEKILCTNLQRLTFTRPI